MTTREADPAAPTTQPRRRRLLAALLACVLVASGALVWWVRSPQAFPAYGNEVSYQRALPAGRGMAVGMLGMVRPPDVVIDRVSARVAEGSAPVAVDAVVCVHRTRGSGVGLVLLGELSEFCSQVLPIAGRNLAAFPRGADIVLSVVPLAPGHVTIRGIDISYRQGVRRGTDVTGIRFRYRPPAR